VDGRVLASGQDQRLTACPSCGGELWVDWDRTLLTKPPQKLAVRCDCGFRRIRLAPVEVGEDGLFWLVDDLRCRVCSHEFTAVVPAGVDDTALECSQCGALSAEVIDDDADGGGDTAVPIGG